MFETNLNQTTYVRNDPEDRTDKINSEHSVSCQRRSVPSIQQSITHARKYKIESLIKTLMLLLPENPR